jgi:two-component system, chemotaxis family, CheB/CheR fusion protein
MAESLSPIVAIGASAGGLDALKQFFRTMPADTGAAFVVIQHLDPNHESLTAEILTRFTEMPTRQVADGMHVEPNHIYVIPPNTYLSLKGHEFHLGKPILQHGVRMPIDAFLSSLSEQLNEKSIAIIVSGTGSDGNLGLRAIKAAGGLAIAQAPETAQYDGMPRSAIATGMVDIVCPVEEMHGHLLAYLNHAYVAQSNGRQKTVPTADGDSRGLDKVLAELGRRLGHDFREYKLGTMARRVSRRMSLHGIHNVDDYLAYLRENQPEARLLFKDLLIGVTSFFRDPDAFGSLDRKVIAPMIESKPADEAVRIWVAGCSTGEEAYSLAMLVIEHCEKNHQHRPIRIFASDIDESSLAVARAGVYPDSVTADISAQRLQRFFSKEDHTYKVGKELRETVTFAVQNLLDDPPFSNIDLISCRNLLIYLNADAQRKILGIFHFALRKNGYLFLGHSETASQREGLFEPLVKKWRIFRRSDAVSAPVLRLSTSAKNVRAIAAAHPQRAESQRLEEIARQQLLLEFAPAAVMINRHRHILLFSGPTSRYLEQPSGAPTLDLLGLVRRELRPKLRVAIRQLIDGSDRIVIENVRLVRDGVNTNVRILLKTIIPAPSSEPLYLITFEEKPGPGATAAVEEADSPTDAAKIQLMEDELKGTREDLQSNIEELESTNEELQAANEEVMSINEELQSTNEELETSHEELQSMNEELATVNSQLKDKIDELARTNDDLANLLSSTDIATLFIDTRMRIGRYTPAARKLANLIPSDIGRPLADIRMNVPEDDLLTSVREVLDKLAPMESQVDTAAGECYLRRITPYRTSDRRVAGVVITFIDITERKRSVMQAERLATVVRDSNDAVAVLKADGEILAWNKGAEQMYGWTEQEALRMNIRQVVPEASRDEAKTMLNRVFRGEAVEFIETRRLCKNGNELDVWLTATPLTDASGKITAVATTERNITERKRVMDQLRSSEANFRALIESAPDAMIIVGATGTIEMANAQATQLFGYSRDELLGMTIENLVPEESRDRHKRARLEYVDVPEIRQMGTGLPLSALLKNGTQVPIEVSLSPILTDHGVVVCAAIRDITERKRSEEALRTAKAVAETALATRARFLATASHDLRQPLQSLNLLNAALLKMIETPKAREMLVMQGESLQGMSRLLNSLLDLTKLESGTVAAMRHDVRIGSIFQRLQATFQARAEESGLELRFDATNAVVHTDPDLLGQLLQNLVSNALRYTRRGFVRVSCVQVAACMRISVSDSGVGIPASELENIFIEFHQVDRDPQERHGGLGLGLAIVQRIAALLETRVDVQSELGQGSVFSISVPIGEPDPGVAGMTHPGNETPPLIKAHLLLIDDDPAVLAATRALLSMEAGFSLSIASSVDESMAAISNRAPDLIITDLHLDRRHSGVDIIRMARKQTGRHMPAIVVTGDAAMPVEALAAEGIEFMSKPVDAGEMISTIRLLLEEFAGQ